MNIGILGAGKLGTPVGLAIESKGHDVTLYDTNPHVAQYLYERKWPFQEEGLQPLLDNTQIKVAGSVGELVTNTDLIFVAIQTPHHPKYEGSTPIPNDRRDFDYTHLEAALRDVSKSCGDLAVKRTVAVISTCLPGTYEARLKPLVGDNVNYVYTPQFIAMGNVVADYLNPEFNLIGVEDVQAADQLELFYATINDAPNLRTDITTAEAIKVSYNTFITMKTVLGNTWGELCDKLGANVDDVFKAWSLSTKRLLSPSYLRAGVGDGGGCHPRDNIALSWVAEQCDLSHNLFEDLMASREAHMEWLAKLAFDASQKSGLPLTILGRSFKPETNIETGSPAVLASNILKDHGVLHAHVEDVEELRPGVYLIGTAHKRYATYKFPKGSIVIDPHRLIPDQDGVIIKRIGDNIDRTRNTRPAQAEYKGA